MADRLEDLFVAECRRQGHHPDADAMGQVAVILAGSSLNDQNLIVMPGKGSLSPADLVRSLRGSMPESFSEICADKPDAQPAGRTLTERYRAEIEASRLKRSLPSDWQQVRAKYDANSVTSQHLREREAEWK